MTRAKELYPIERWAMEDNTVKGVWARKVLVGMTAFTELLAGPNAISNSYLLRENGPFTYLHLELFKRLPIKDQAKIALERKGKPGIDEVLAILRNNLAKARKD